MKYKTISEMQPITSSSHPRLYQKWQNMHHQSCGCEWQTFSSFARWATGENYKENRRMRIVRFNKKRAFSYLNCKLVDYGEWVEREYKPTNNRWVMLDGEKLCFKDAAAKLGVDKANLSRWFSPHYPNRKVPAHFADRIVLASAQTSLDNEVSPPPS